jgi:2-keto-4-pentenoate hydratase/2-oxohepta-3-ene-1,7-dioic acid hydratase in catechol pathway
MNQPIVRRDASCLRWGIRGDEGESGEDTRQQIVTKRLEIRSNHDKRQQGNILSMIWLCPY